jgi:hypothetical protein
MKIMKKISRNVRNEDLNKSNKKHSGQYYQQTRSNRRKNIRDGRQGKEVLHVNYRKGKNEYIWLSHKRTLRHDQKTKTNNSQWERRK